MNKPVIAVDLDGTIAHYDGWQGYYTIGDPIPGAKEFLDKLRADGFKIVINTVRANDGNHKVVQSIQEWFTKHELPFDDIYTGMGKLDALAFVDDRGVQCRPQESDTAYKKALKQINFLMNKKRKR